MSRESADYVGRLAQDMKADPELQELLEVVREALGGRRSYGRDEIRKMLAMVRQYWRGVADSENAVARTDVAEHVYRRLRQYGGPGSHLSERRST